MGNNLVVQLESNLEKVCEQLVANDAAAPTTATLQWSHPPFEDSHLRRFLDCWAQNRTMTRLVLRDLDTLNDYQLLAIAIQKHPTVTALRFFGRLPTDLVAFGQVFRDKPQLTELEFKSCDKVPAAVIDGIQSILQNNDIDTFLMNDCRLECSELERLTQGLLLSRPRCSTLKTLQIAVKRSVPSARAVENVAQFLHHGKHDDSSNLVLQDVHLAGFLQANAMAALFHAASGHQTLRRLKLTGAAVNDESLRGLRQLLSNSPALRVLDFSSCDIHGEGSVHLAKALAENQTLRELYLSYNSMGDDGIQVLSKVLGREGDGNEEGTKCASQLEVLDVRLNRIGCAGIKALSTSLCSNSTLRALHIGEEFVIPGRRFEQDDIKALVDMLVQNKTLQDLYMEDASVGDSDFVILLDALAKNTSLRRLCVSCFSTASLERLVASLGMLHLQKLFVRVHGSVQLDKAFGENILKNLEVSSCLNELNISGLKDDSKTTWKALQPRIQTMLNMRAKQEDTQISPSKRLVDDTNDRDKIAKRPRGE